MILNNFLGHTITYLVLDRELKKLWKIKMSEIPILTSALGTVLKGLAKNNQGHPDNCIIKISLNNYKIPGALRRFALT